MAVGGHQMFTRLRAEGRLLRPTDSVPSSRRCHCWCRDGWRSVADQPLAEGIARRPIFVYDIPMGGVNDSQIEAWAAEAEAGYDVAELKKRGRGRPGRGAEPMQVVAVRLTAEEIKALDQIAERGQISRSEAIRQALVHYAA